MSEQLGIADAITFAGGVVTIAGALNLDKRWGLPAVAAGRVLDCIDGTVARVLGSESEDGAFRDKVVDRITEGFIVGGLVQQDVIPYALPAVGYGLRMSTQVDEANPPVAGLTAIYLKDLALGLGLLSTWKSENVGANALRTAARTIGWGAVALGCKVALETKK